ncbi:GNAT family N-acetyltransferase [Salibacterium halotolerans]|uniref:Ribosomal protein S18 acetylase RimI n=1 Tax=Salibacterium halotolerans TaxID=1884432 RepID=A0A1I5U6P0_9BACI|nr:GNAT family N-acetyltransferase [Salibacterium halotolerans]SFP90924.1 Ribosomal protein S18 acetylase RimI [Salibacterium halotolerans]
MNPVIRKAGTKDIPAIQTVAETSWTQTYETLIPSEVQRKFLDMAYSSAALSDKLASDVFLVAEYEGEPAAFANLHQSGQENELAAIYVHPSCYWMGLGTALMEKVKEEAGNKETIVVYLEVGNDRAERFYRKMGFREISVFTETLFGHTLQTMKMEYYPYHSLQP